MSYKSEFDLISVSVYSHYACAMSRDLSLGAKIVHIFKIPDPNLPLALHQRLSHVIAEK